MKNLIPKITILAIILITSFLTCCKKESTTTTNTNQNNTIPVENTTNYAIYDSIKIPFDNAVVIKVEDYFYQQGFVNNFVLCLSANPVAYSTVHNVFQGVGNGVAIRFNSKNKTYFQATDYIVDNNNVTKGSFTMTYYTNRNFFMHSGGQMVTAKTGSGSVVLTGNVYEININCTLTNNKSFIVHYKGSLGIYVLDYDPTF